MKRVNENTLKQAAILMGEILDRQNKLAALLNCKVSDSGKEVAKIMEAEGLKVYTTGAHGNNYSIHYKAGSADGFAADTDAMKKLLTERGIEIPMKPRKGASATAIAK